ncbi:MAG: hydrolase, partial [Treponemataceae bacterium]|nr:hydrolase [Treponemataceae bacterium]
APKAMYFISGDRDGVNPVEGTNNAYEKMRKIWQANGADDKLVTTMNAGLTHSFPEEQQKLAFDWLDTVFK